MPSRASFATGRYVHELGNWDNAMAYDGSVPGWGHALQRRGHRVDSIGKLHYTNIEDPTGFDHQYHPMHIYGGHEIFAVAQHRGIPAEQVEAPKAIPPIPPPMTWALRFIKDTQRDFIDDERLLTGPALQSDHG